MKQKIIYLGVVGQIAAGKGILKDYLVDKLGFISFSLSTILHDELEKRKIKKYTRKTLQDLGDELRKKYGRDILAKKAIKRFRVSRFTFHDKIIIEGIRNPGEIEYLKKLPYFILVGVKAKREFRYKRLLQRAKPWDPKTWEEFLDVDRRDLGADQKKDGQQVGICLHYCDYILTNNKSTEDFRRKIKQLTKEIINS